MIKIAVIEDNKDIRESLKILLNGSEGFKCIAAYKCAEDAIINISTIEPDVILMDINLPGMSGIECTLKIKEAKPTVQIIMQTVYEDSKSIFESLKAGASGYLLKRTPPAKILEAIEDVQNGGSPMSSQIARMVVHSFQNKNELTQVFNLSTREKELLDLLSQGYRYKEIAEKMFIAMDTVRSHIRRIYEKLHVTSRTEAVIKYIQK